MFISSLFCCLSFFNIGPVLIVDRNNDVFSQAMLEETLTKNLHLQQDLEHMSQVTIIVFFGWYLSAPLFLNQSLANNYIPRSISRRWSGCQN